MSDSKQTITLTSQARQALMPLIEFYERSGQPVPAIEPIEGREMPEPYRSLLVHQGDMTPVLEDFFGERIVLKVLQSRCDEARMRREVVLVGKATRRAMEFGAIGIELEPFPPQARAAIRACQQPLGTILREAAVQHTSQPSLYFRVVADELMESSLMLEQPAELFGRCNELRDGQGALLARVVEILPRIAETEGVLP